MRILITGGAGFIGSHLYDALCVKYDVFVVDSLVTGNPANLPMSAQLVVQDIRKLTPADLDGIEIVFHCAALARVQPSIQNPMVYHDVNVNGTLNLLECCRNAKVTRVVFSSSSSVYGDKVNFPTKETAKTDPISPYGLQKLIGEQYCQLYAKLYGLDTVCLRYFNVYGERMPTSGAYRTVLGIFQQQKAAGVPLTITNDGTQQRDFTYVKDVVNANIAAMLEFENFDGESINIGSGKSYSINTIAQAFNVPVTYTGTVLEPHTTLADNTQARRKLHWEPTGDVLDWIKKL